MSGYEAGGAALGDWNGAKGIQVAPSGGATFGIGVALKNVTGKPLAITGVNAINGFIRLIGTHFRAYTPAVGSAIGSPIVHEPYGEPPERLGYVLRPNVWVGLSSTSASETRAPTGPRPSTTAPSKSPTPRRIASSASRRSRRCRSPSPAAAPASAKNWGLTPIFQLSLSTEYQTRSATSFSASLAAASRR